MIINENAKTKKLSNNILSLAQKAKQAKDLNKDTINATIGMLFGEDNKFYEFKAVNEALKNLSRYEMFSYSDTNGGARYHQAIKEWVFGKYLKEIEAENHVEVLSTPGGSGAIGLTFANYLAENDHILVPNNMWETYITFAKEFNCTHETYALFDEEGNFGLASLKEKIESLIGKQKNILIVINDPCQNPTGFCMKDSDYDNLIKLLDSYENQNFVLLMDVAYFDFYDENGDLIRSRYQKLTKLKNNTMLIFTFSGSKSFGLYGLRIGALIGVSKSEEEITYFKNAMEFSARNHWGSSSELGISIISELVLNSEYQELFKEEIKNVCNMLAKRSQVFLEAAKEVKLPLLPYERGFFVCVKTQDPVLLMNELHKDNVYVVVTKTCIRVALCAVNLDEAKRLPGLIKKAMERSHLE